MTALDQFWHVVATIIHDRVVETAKTGAWIACCIDDTTGLEHIDDDIGTVLRPPLGPRREGVSDITSCRHTSAPYKEDAFLLLCLSCIYVTSTGGHTARARDA
jgi:hypothetical protein